MVRGKKAWVGFDLGTAGIKFAVLSGNRLEEWGTGLFSRGAIAAGVIRNLDEVSRVVKEMAEEHGLKGCRAVACGGGREVIIRMIQLPKMEKREFSKFLSWEIERHLPFPVDDAVYDYEISRTFFDEEGEKVEVLLVAMRRNISRQIYDIFRNAGLNLEAIDAIPFPLFRLQGGSLARGSFMILDIGAGTTDIAVVHENILVMFRSILIAGNMFTSAISTSVKLSFEEAENLKKEKSFEELEEYIRPPFNDLIGEILRCFDYIIGQFRENIVKKVYITGGGGAIRGFDSALEEELGLPVERINPLEGLSLGPVEERDFEDLKNRWGVAIGLALRGVF